MNSYLVSIRRLVLSNQTACRNLHRLGGGTEAGIERALNSEPHLTAAFKSATRLKREEVERLINSVMGSNKEETTKATYNDVQHILMAEVAATKGS